jgi:hypothetical protein
MKSFFSLSFILLVFLTIFGTGGLLWYLSYSTEFTRKDTHTSALPPARTTPAPNTPPAAPAPAKPAPAPAPAHP